MAWGGARTGSGRRKKSLDEQLATRVEHKKAVTVTAFPEPDLKLEKIGQLEKQSSFVAPDYLDIASKEDDGTLPSASEIFNALAEFVDKSGCSNLIDATLIEDFSFLRHSYLECERFNKVHGRISGGKKSPYVTMSLDYNKQALTIYTQIWQIIRENSQTKYDGGGGNEFLALLAGRGF
jgi:hypothetical protein